MTRYEQILQRMHSVTRTRTQVELAMLLEIKQSSISDAKKRQSVPGDWYMKLFEKIGVNPDWLKKGTGPIYLRTDAGYFPSNGDGTTIKPDLLIDPLSISELVTVYSMRADDAKESFPLIPHKPAGKMAVSKTYTGDGIVVLKVDNDAASPTVRRGAYIGIDTLCTHPVSGEIFAISMPYEGIILRKLFWKQDENCFILRAENKEFPDIYINAEQKIHIFGRLSWVIQKL